jgi:hypothetical protein
MNLSNAGVKKNERGKDNKNDQVSMINFVSIFP